MRRSAIVAFVVGLTTVIAASSIAWALTPREGEAVEGVIVAGVRVDHDTDPRALVRDHATRWLDEEIWLEAGTTTERLRRAEIGYSLDVDACARALLAIGRSGDGLADLGTRVRARLGRVRVTLAPRFDAEALRVAIQSLASRFDRGAMGAEIDDAGRLVSPPLRGRSIDVEASLARVVAGLDAGERRFELVVRDRPPPVDPARIARASEPVIIGSYVTRYRMRGDEGPRAVNVRVAAEALDGAVIAPGERLSFNERVGPRTIGRGYRVAHVIYDGEMIDGIGGGVCQVASTLHAAAFLAGLPIDEHSPHSRPSAYIPMGLDATVTYPSLDLVIGNPSSVPITVRAHASGGQLEIALWARARPIEVEWDREILARMSYDERVIEDASVPMGEARVSQEGGPGFVIERRRVVHTSTIPGSAAITERRTLRYPPTDRIVRVAPGYSFDSSTGPVVSTIVSGVPASTGAAAVGVIPGED
ncbi:MAG: VanW family protein [Deltaproteobacteria bacterium]|nr:VanW family protein [Deltaproteobacteria bacterium]